MSPQAAVDGAILVINAGSSSLKFALYGWTAKTPKALDVRAAGQVDRIGGAARLRASQQDAQAADIALAHGLDQAGALTAMLDWITDQLGALRLLAVGHRVVHGGMQHVAPVRVDRAILQQLTTLDPLAPLHQPHNLAAIERLLQAYPDVPQIACFDTAFHANWPDHARRFALPRTLHDAGVRRYGFHGLSYEYLAAQMARVAPHSRRVVLAHLGSGASMCALKDGVSIECSLGFTALDGLPMATRCGPLDPGVVFHLFHQHGYDFDAIEQMLYRDSGMKGVSGLASDMRDLLASDLQSARQAVDLFVYHCSRQVAAMAAAMGGIDALVFSAGIGEHNAQIRAAICAPLGFLGLHVDAAANADHRECISSGEAACPVFVLPTDEESVIAGHCARLLNAS